MKHTNTLLTSFSILVVSGAGIAYALQPQLPLIERSSAEIQSHAAADVPVATEDVEVSTVAMRLQRRLRENGTSAPSLAMLDDALSSRAAMMQSGVTVYVTDPNNVDAPPATWIVNFVERPELLTVKSSLLSASVVIDETSLARQIDDGAFDGMRKQQTAIVEETYIDAKRVTRAAASTPIARDGYKYDARRVAGQIATALLRGDHQIHLELPYEPALLQMRVDGELRTLSLLSEGVSDYSNSPEGRIWNVHKAIEERVNNAMVRQGEEFSMIAALDAPITTQKGWREELGLFGGGAAMTPGAGICQSSTTVYRAALLAGLPITYRRYHSMFVDHYEPYGVGLDATIFPGHHDLTFINDTPGDIVMQAYIEGDLVYVRMYGLDDDRTVALDGPYFNTTPNRPKTIRPLAWDQIAWEYTVNYADGRTKESQIYSTFSKGFASSVKRKYANTPGIILLSSDTAHLEKESAHAAAPVQ